MPYISTGYRIRCVSCMSLEVKTNGTRWFSHYQTCSKPGLCADLYLADRILAVWPKTYFLQSGLSILNVIRKSCGFVEICDFVHVRVYIWNNYAVEMLWSMFNDLCAESLSDWLEVVFSPDVTPSDWLGSKHQLTNSSLSFVNAFIYLEDRMFI